MSLGNEELVRVATALDFNVSDRSMPEPFFSVILPTKDRAALALSVIRHTLRQSFSDFELIFVDNGSDAVASTEAAALGDPRLKIVRTGGLSMPDNWQAGLEHARGQYIVMIEDKLFLVHDALAQCARILAETESPIISWLMGVCDGEHCSSLAPIKNVDAFTLRSELFFFYGSHCMLDRYQKQAPRGINMLVKREFANQVQMKVGRLCRPMAPDYSMGALLLPFVDSFVYVNAILGRVLINGPSTGEHVGKRASAANAFLESLGMTDEELLSHVPLKIKTLHNLMVSDLFRFWEAAGVSESKARLDHDGYLLMMIGDCVLMRKQDLEFRNERRQISQAFRERSITAKFTFLRYALRRFIAGWPNRKSRMRENLPDALNALKCLVFG